MKEIFNEFLLTFSNKPSFLSSKKLERFAVFTVFLTLSVIYLSLHIKDISAGDFAIFLGAWLGYGGVNSLLLQRDKKVDKETKDEIEG